MFLCFVVNIDVDVLEGRSLASSLHLWFDLFGLYQFIKLLPLTVVLLLSIFWFCPSRCYLTVSVSHSGAHPVDQQSDLSSSTSICVSLPVSADGSSSLVRS